MIILLFASVNSEKIQKIVSACDHNYPSDTFTMCVLSKQQPKPQNHFKK